MRGSSRSTPLRCAAIYLSNRRRSNIAAPHAVLPPPRPGQFEPIAARSAGSATYCSMYPHDMQICRSGTIFFQNETASLFIGPRAPDFGGPTRMSVDWHFGHFPDFKSHPLRLRFRSVRPTALGVDGRGLRGHRLLLCRRHPLKGLMRVGTVNDGHINGSFQLRRRRHLHRERRLGIENCERHLT